MNACERPNSPAHERRIRLVMVVGGFPHPGQPYRGIFNLQAAQALAQWTDLTVVFLRSWLPGRSVWEVSQRDGLRVITLAVPQLPSDRSINLVLYRSLGWLLLRPLLRTCDLLHSVDAAGVGTMASTWGWRAGVPHVTQVIGSDINSMLPRMRSRAAIAGWEQRVDGVACNSRALAVAFQVLYPHARNVCTIYRGVDLDRFHPIGPATGPLAGRPPVRFLFLGGFTPYPTLPHRANTKGGETLLAAWRAAETELVAAGASLQVAGPYADGESVARWRACLRDPQRVHVAGAVPPEMVPAYLRSADVVLLPSMEEGLPNVAMEASACARPVIGSAVGGIPEVVVQGETGLLLPPGEVTAWKEALVACARQGDRLPRTGEYARQRMEAHFDRRSFAPGMLDLYRAVLRGRVCEVA